jgi:acetyltransferase-like isoleucine patch superfamily enzyme
VTLYKNPKFNRFLVYLSNHVVSRIVFSSVRMWWYRRVMRFSIGPGSSILTDFRVATCRNISIGSNCVVNNGCRFDNRYPIRIGNNVSVSYGTHILTKGHDMNDPDFKTVGSSVIIEDRVWTCTNAMILPGVRLGQGSVVLSGAVVTKDVEPYSVVGGNPAQIIRTRSRDLRYTLSYDAWVPFWG